MEHSIGIMDQQSKHSGQRVFFLDSYRALAIIMVVALHALPFSALDSSFERLVVSVASIAVPVFFFIDGFLLMNKVHSSALFDYWSYILKSGNRLLIPWLLFSCCYTALRLALEYFNLVSNHKLLGHSVLDVLKAIYLSSVAGQLYFLPSLFLIRLWANCIKMLVAFPSCLTALIFVSYTYMYTEINPAHWLSSPDGNEPVLHALWGMHYYLFGATVFAYRNESERYAKMILVICVGVTLFAVLSIPGYPRIAQYSYLLGAYILFSRSLALNSIHSMGKYTMGIYLLHYPVVIMFVSSVSNYVLSKSSVLHFVFVTFFTFTISLALTISILLLPFGQYVFGQLTSWRKVRSGLKLGAPRSYPNLRESKGELDLP